MKAKYNYKKIFEFLFLIIYIIICLTLIWNIIKINKNHLLRYHNLSPKLLESIENVDTPLVSSIQRKFFLRN